MYTSTVDFKRNQFPYIKKKKKDLNAWKSRKDTAIDIALDERTGETEAYQ